MIIGLTGNIASGKSLAGAILASWGAKVIDADQIAREIVRPGQKGLELLVQSFGQKILQPDGELNRAYLGQLIFNNQNQREQLNQLLHPLIEVRLQEIAAEEQFNPSQPALVLEIPLLFECNLTYLVDEIWLIKVEPAIQLDRLQSRNQLSRTEALQRMAAQMPQSQKELWADRIIDNSSSQTALLEQLKKLWQEILS